MKRKVHVLCTLCVWVLLLSSCSKAIEEENESAVQSASTETAGIDTEDAQTYLDGEYVVVTRGYKKGMNVQVTFKDSQITDIQVLDNNEDEPYLTDSLTIIPTILETQSVEVDTVSGATKTCQGIMKAVKLAKDEANANAQ